jgi:hypothetical protein
VPVRIAIEGKRLKHPKSNAVIKDYLAPMKYFANPRDKLTASGRRGRRGGIRIAFADYTPKGGYNARVPVRVTVKSKVQHYFVQMTAIAYNVPG